MRNIRKVYERSKTTVHVAPAAFYSIHIFLAVFALCFALLAHAEGVDELRGKIDARNTEIENLEKEIVKLENDIDETRESAQTLQNAIKTLDLTDRKLSTDIQLTNKKITSTGLTIDRLAIEIADKEEKISHGMSALAEGIREVNELESRSLAEIILSQDGFSGFWNSIQNVTQFQAGVQTQITDLEDLKAAFLKDKNVQEIEKRRLVSLKNQLGAQKTIVAQNKAEKNSLLKETKNKESNYKKILEDQRAKKDALERELREFEEQLRVEIDPTSLPKTGKGVLRWPLSTVKITQYFGNTPFASANPQVYNGGGHNGIDLRAAPGTPVKSAASGTVVSTGDTDKQCRGVSYGRWVLIRHNNGLSTLYAHLSLISVSGGMEIQTGDLVGYSGNTGYSTGPHLHFAVYATQAVQVMNKRSRVCGTNLTLPVSSTNGYLNPLSYL